MTDGDHRRVVDIVRDTGMFSNMRGLARAIQVLLDATCELEIVRCKDRLNDGGNSYGYRDILMNVRLRGNQHVGEVSAGTPSPYSPKFDLTG